MNLKENTPQLWDCVWRPYTEEQDRYNIIKTQHSIRWKRIKKEIRQRFGGFKGLNVIELGAGQGTYALLFALKGAKVTVLDYSKKAIESSKLLFKRHNCNAKFINSDALNLNKKLFSKFDVAMSFGTAEHFIGKNRFKFICAHFNAVKQGGTVLISTPNKWNPIYSLWKFLSQSFNRWNFGIECPFSRTEWKRVGKILKCNFKFMGGSLFIDTFKTKSRIRKFLGIKESKDVKKIKYEIGTPLDKYFSRSLMVISTKPYKIQ